MSEQEFNRDDWYDYKELEEFVKTLVFPDIHRLKGLYVSPKKVNGETLWSKAEVKVWAEKATAPL